MKRLKPSPPHAYEALASELEILIRGGHFVVGDRLPSERQLAETFGVSRPTVRAALGQLETRGLLSTRSGSGSFVLGHRPTTPALEPRPEHLLGDILTVRLALEVPISRLAARHAPASPSGVEQIRSAVEALERTAAPSQVPHQLDTDFHRSIAALTDNAYLIELLDPMWSAMAGPPFEMEFADNWSTEATRRTAMEHRAIYEAVSASDCDLAAFAMEHHLRSLIATLLGDSALGRSPTRL